MITVTTNELESWLTGLFWPFTRIGACFMVAPVFSAVAVPMRIRVVLAGAIALLIAPLVSVPAVAPISPAGMLITAQQVLIGAALGFSLRILFDAMALGGTLLANSMGLSFAFNLDPLHGASTPALGQLYTLLVTLLFLVMNGHLALIRVLVAGFHTLPIGEHGLGTQGLWAVVVWGRQLFSGALAVALPGVTALLIANLAFGVVNRAAPALNIFAVGLPVSLVFGFIVMIAGLPSLQSGFIRLLAETMRFLQHLSGA